MAGREAPTTAFPSFQVSLRQVRGDKNLEVMAELPRIVHGRGSPMKNLEPFDRKSPEV